MAKILISFSLVTFAVQLDYTADFLVDIVLLISSHPSSFSQWCLSWILAMRCEDLKCGASFCRNPGLPLDSHEVVRLGSVISSLLDSWLGKPLWVPASSALVDLSRSLLDHELNCDQKGRWQQVPSVTLAALDLVCLLPEVEFQQSSPMGRRKIEMPTHSVHLPRAQNSGRQILLASKMSHYFLLLDLEKSSNAVVRLFAATPKAFYPNGRLCHLRVQDCVQQPSEYGSYYLPFGSHLDKSIDYWSKLWQC